MRDRLPRLPLRWAELRRAPLHDFPIRDEVLYQYFGWSPELSVLEIGPGSGFTASWLARQVRRLTLLDAASRTIEDLRQQLGHISNIDYAAASACQLNLADRWDTQFDVVFGLDVFDLIPDPRTTLRNFAECLRPGGQLLLSFPNVPPPRAKGVTCFARVEELEAILADVGFSRWEIFNIRPRRTASIVYTALHEIPLRLFRRIRAGNKREKVQVYEATWAFQHRNSMSWYRPVLHSYWMVLGWFLRLGGDVFTTDRNRSSILDGQLVVRAWR